MSYAPIDVTFDECPKYAERTAAEMGIIACAITYANRNLSDGRIPKVWPERRFGPEGKKLAARMVELKVWEIRPDGDFDIVGFLDHNPSRELVQAKRAKKVSAGHAGGVVSAEHRKQASAQAPGAAGASSTGQAPAQPISDHTDTDTAHSTSRQEEGGGFRLPESETRLWGQQWIEQYQSGIRAGLGRDWIFDPQHMSHLESCIETFCKDKTRIAEWVGKAAREFAKATRLEDAKLWSGHQPKGLLRWMNENRPGYTGPREPRQTAAPRRTEAPLEKPTMTHDQIAAAAAEVADAARGIGRGGDG